MRISHIRIEGFRAFAAPAETTMGEFTTIVGRNDAGKSTILHALDVFFGATPDAADFNYDSGPDGTISIEVSFGDLPDQIELEKGVPTNLAAENLLDESGRLTIQKIYSKKNPKKPTVRCLVHDYDDVKFQNLCSLKEKELNERCTALGIEVKKSGSGITNHGKRLSIRAVADAKPIPKKATLIEPLEAASLCLDILPEYSLFRADESLNEEDTAFQKQFKSVVESAVNKIPGKAEIEAGIEAELNAEMQKIHHFLSMHTDEVTSITARPSFKWKDLISFYLECKDKQGKEIALSKRGSGLRRLLMVAYFQYLASKLREDVDSKSHIYAIEEPETYLHPGAQRMLVTSFKEIAASAQIIVSSHSPVFAGSTDTDSLVLVLRDASGSIMVSGRDLDLERVASELGVEPSDQIHSYKAILFLEGFDDCDFFNVIAKALSGAGLLESHFEAKQVGLLPFGGSNLKHWVNRKTMKTLNRRFAVVLDSDKTTKDAAVSSKKLNLKEAIEKDGGLCHILRKREIENYLHPEIIETHTKKSTKALDLDYADLKTAIYPHICGLAQHMSVHQIREREKYIDGAMEKYELTEICSQVLALAI